MTSPTYIQHTGPGRYTCDPAAALHAIIEDLGSAAPWAMLALCVTPPPPRANPIKTVSPVRGEYSPPARAFRTLPTPRPAAARPC